jgi:hypothetical protein
MITVITSLTGGKDTLRDDQTLGQAEWVAFTDEATSNVWNVKPVYDKFKSARRNSRIHKMLPHLFVNSRYSIWIDANLSLRIPPEEVVERYLKNHDIAMFAHPSRDCLYDEALVCAKNGLDDPEIIIEQVKTYEDKGFGKHKVLPECNVIIRRHTDKVREFNEAWWAEYCRYSVRDQISCMYTADKVGLDINIVNVPWTATQTEAFRGDVIHAVPHLTAQTEV